MRWLMLLVVAVGCGEVKAKPDGGGGDDDAPNDSGVTVGEATFELRLGGVATAGKAVVFSNPDGTIASEAMTDNMGIAKATIMTGAMVTVSVSSTALITIGGVKPGDHIVLKNPPPYDSTAVSIVSFGAASEATSKSYYRADWGDDEYVTVVNMTSGTRSLDLLKGNLDSTGKASLVAGVYDASDRLIAYTSLANVTPNLGGTTTVTFPAYKTDMVNVNVSLSGAPSDATLLTVDSANEQAGMLYMPSAFAGIDKSSVSGGNAAVIVPYMGSYGEFVQTSATVTFATTTESFTFSRRQPRPAGAFVIAAANMPARLGGAVADTTTDPTRPKLTWTNAGAGGDAIAVRLNWRNGANTQFYWHAFLPPDATSVTVPVVSSAMATQGPNGTSFFTNLTVKLHDLEPLAGYDAFRAAPPIDFANPVLPVGMTTWTASETHKTL